MRGTEMRKRNADKPSPTLQSWRTLTAQLSGLTEAQVRQLLDTERANRRRTTIIRRLHQRLTRLRATRERSDLRRNP